MLKDYQVHIEIDDNVKGVAVPPRHIPFNLQKCFQDEIQKTKQDDIIEEHSGPSPCNLAPKDDNEIRVTVDMRNVNKAIKQTLVPIPRAEDN